MILLRVYFQKKFLSSYFKTLWNKRYKHLLKLSGTFQSVAAHLLLDTRVARYSFLKITSLLTAFNRVLDNSMFSIPPLYTHFEVLISSAEKQTIFLVNSFQILLLTHEIYLPESILSNMHITTSILLPY